MKRTITILAFFFALITTGNLFAQSNLQDVIVLINGDIYCGKIIEKSEELISIETDNGTYGIAVSTIEKITQETVDEIKYKKELRKAEEIKYEKPVNNISAKVVIPYRDPIVSTFMSFIIPGAGQIYNYEVSKGVGFIIWGVASQTLLGYSLYMIPQRNNEEYQEDWVTVAGLSAASYLICWITSMVDANKTSKKINSEGLYSMNLGSNKTLSISPDLSLVNDYSKPNTSSSQASYGMKIKLAF